MRGEGEGGGGGGAKEVACISPHLFVWEKGVKTYKSYRHKSWSARPGVEDQPKGDGQTAAQQGPRES